MLAHLFVGAIPIFKIVGDKVHRLEPDRDVDECLVYTTSGFMFCVPASWAFGKRKKLRVGDEIDFVMTPKTRYHMATYGVFFLRKKGAKRPLISTKFWAAVFDQFPPPQHEPQGQPVKVRPKKGKGAKKK